MLPEEIIRAAVQDSEFIMHYEDTETSLVTPDGSKQRGAALFLANSSVVATETTLETSETTTAHMEQGTPASVRARNMSVLVPGRRGSVLAGRRGSVLAGRRGSLLSRMNKPSPSQDVTMSAEDQRAGWELVRALGDHV